MLVFHTIYHLILSRQTGGGVKPNKQKYSYQRPAFLKLATEDEIQVIFFYKNIILFYKKYNLVLESSSLISQVTADHAVRPIIVPRDVSILPWSAGYAETINAGKSRHNEDQAMARQGSIGVVVGGRLVNVPYTMFAVFDGHAGAGCAVTASNDLWQAIQVIQ